MCLEDFCIISGSVYWEVLGITGEYLVVGLAETRDVLLVVEAEEL
jgi:hypothetical protein